MAHTEWVCLVCRSVDTAWAMHEECMRQTTYGYTPPTRASVIISLQHPDHTSCLQPGCKKQDCKGNRVERVEGGVCPTLLA